MRRKIDSACAGSSAASASIALGAYGEAGHQAGIVAKSSAAIRGAGRLSRTASASDEGGEVALRLRPA